MPRWAATTTKREFAMANHGCGIMNNTSEKLGPFCLSNDLVIGGTLFPHNHIHNHHHRINVIHLQTQYRNANKQVKRPERRDKRA